MKNPVSVALNWLALAPRNVAILVLIGYRVVVSPLYGEVCRYYPSCSRYALDAIARFGIVRGCVLAIRRIGRCHPWAAGGVDDVPERAREWTHRTPHGFVLPGLK